MTLIAKFSQLAFLLLYCLVSSNIQEKEGFRNWEYGYRSCWLKYIHYYIQSWVFHILQFWAQGRTIFKRCHIAKKKTKQIEMFDYLSASTIVNFFSSERWDRHPTVVGLCFAAFTYPHTVYMGISCPFLIANDAKLTVKGLTTMQT